MVIKLWMLASIITPLFNTERFVSAAIESVLRQSFGDWEMIIVDDFSTDNSAAIVERYARDDRRIRILRRSHNEGPAICRNSALTLARGRYICFLDSDDVWLPEKLEKQIAFMQRQNVAFSHTYYEKIDEEGNALGKIMRAPHALRYEDLLRSNQIGCLTAMYDSQQLGKIPMPVIRKRHDYGLWLRILRTASYAYCLPEILARYRVRSSSISSNKLELLKYNWRLFRDMEGLSISKSAYYLSWNVARKVLGG